MQIYVKEDGNISACKYKMICTFEKWNSSQ